MKRFIIPLTLLILLVTSVFGVFFWWSIVNKPVNSADNSKKSLLITRGMTAEEVGEKLEENGLIKSAIVFKFYVQLTGQSASIQAGEFMVSPSFNISQILETLSGPPAELWVTVPEGLRREEIAEKFISGLEMNSQNATIFRQEFMVESAQLEGYLFPDTYLFPREVTAQTVVSRMKKLFDQKVSTLIQNSRVSDMTLNQLVILASIIERETKTDSERPIVAGVFINRLNDDIALQADATVQYALANIKCKGKSECNWWVTPVREDLEVNSPFNTYKYPGIPPAPIANPGFSSLSAAFNPAITDYYYYIHDSEGTIHFAQNLNEHNQNIRKYLNN